MLTESEIEAALKLLGPHKKFPYYFVDYPEVNVLLDLLPNALEEIKRLRSVNKPSGYDSPYAGAVKDELEKLRVENELLRCDREQLKASVLEEATEIIRPYIIEIKQLRAENERLEIAALDRAGYHSGFAIMDSYKTEIRKLTAIAKAAKMICDQVIRYGHVYLSEEMVARLAADLKALDEDGK